MERFRASKTMNAFVSRFILSRPLLSRPPIRLLVMCCALLTLFAIPRQSLLVARTPAPAPSQKEAVKREEARWAHAGFQKPKIIIIDVQRFYRKSPPPLFTHSFDITLVMFRDSGWKKKVILERLKKVAAIYARCRIRIGKARLVIVTPPGGTVDFYRPGHRDQEIAKSVPPTAKPILFYFRSIPKYNAYAWNQSSEDDQVSEAIKNTAWFSLSVTMPLNKKIRRRGYISEAHELGHIFLDSLEHTPPREKNLMAREYQDVNGDLTPSQCQKIKRHPLIKAIRVPDPQ